MYLKIKFGLFHSWGLQKYHKITQHIAGWGGVPPSPAWARQRPGQRWEQLQRQQLHHAEQRDQRVQRGGVRQRASSQNKEVTIVYSY